MRSLGAILGRSDPVVVDSQASVLDAVRTMAERHVGALPVVDGDRLVGIFTERDVMSRVVATGMDAAAARVGEVMSTQLVVADAGECCDTGLHRLRAARVRHLIVLNAGRMAGALSLRDLLAADADEKSEEIDFLNAYVHCVPPSHAEKPRV